MVALLVTLRLRLWWNAVRGHRQRLAVTVVGAVLAALAVLVALGVGAGAGTDPVRGPATAVVLLTAVSAGWVVLPLLAFGVDESLDPARFSPFPRTAAGLAPGLLVAACCGLPAVTTLAIALALVPAFCASLVAVAAAVVAAPAGLLTVVLLSRVVTTALARVLRGRRFRDLAAVTFTLVLAFAGLAVNALLRSRLASRGLGAGVDDATVQRLAGAAAWTPLGWVWGVPAALVRGDLTTAGVQAVLAVAFAAGLFLTWRRLLADALVTRPERDTGGAVVGSSRTVDALTPDSRIGAVAGRLLRSWRRDPRFLTTAVTGAAVPLVLVLWSALEGSDSSWGAGVPVLAAYLVTSAATQDTAYDRRSLWMHAAAGLPGHDDRCGRLLAIAVWGLPVVTAATVLSLAVSRVDAADGAAVVGLVIAVLLGGGGVAAWASARWPGPAPRAGQSPFAAEPGSALRGIALMATHVVGTALAVAPTAVLAVALRHRAAGIGLVPLAALFVGAGALVLGVRTGGRRLDRTWPELVGER